MGSKSGKKGREKEGERETERISKQKVHSITLGSQYLDIMKAERKQQDIKESRKEREKDPEKQNSTNPLLALLQLDRAIHRNFV